MFAVAVMVMPLFVGLLLILLIARFAPHGGSVVSSGDGSGGPNGVRDERPSIGADRLKEVLEQLADGLGLQVVGPSISSGGVVEMTLCDLKPLSAGRILLLATAEERPLEAAEVLAFAESARGDNTARKAVVVAVGGFTRAARAASVGAVVPLELISGAELLELVEAHGAAQQDEELAAFRGFGPAHSSSLDGKDNGPTRDQQPAAPERPEQQ